MDSFRKHASRLKEQVAKQQQAVARQFSSHGYGSSQGSDPTIVTDEAELQRHQQLEKLYTSTRAGKHFQRDIVKGVEGTIINGRRQIEVVDKLCEESCTYATEGLGTRALLGKALLHYGTNRTRVEREREILFNSLTTQVVEPFKAMVNGSSLEDARHLAQRYDRMRQEAEAQAIELGKRQARGVVASGGEGVMKLQIAESKMQEIASSMAVLGKEAAAAMTTVETHQQHLTFQRLITLIEAESAYHKRAAEVLDQIQAQIVLERQRHDSTLPHTQAQVSVIDTIIKMPTNGDAEVVGKGLFGGLGLEKAIKKPMMFYLAEVMHAFVAESEGELSLAVGDMVIVRQVAESGWSEGECNGKAGWFPSTYVMPKNNI